LPPSRRVTCCGTCILHLASKAGVVVRGYSDEPIGIGETQANGAGRFRRVTLRPRIEVLAGTDLSRADAIHHEIHEFCFIARSVNFPISIDASYIEVAGRPTRGQR